MEKWTRIIIYILLGAAGAASMITLYGIWQLIQLAARILGGT